MPTTPPLDNKQEPVEYTTDTTWGDSCEPYHPNGKEASAALKRIMAKLRAMRDDAEDRVGPYNDKESKEFRKRLREFVCANDVGEKTKAFNAAYDALYALLSVHPELIKLPDMVSVDELKIGVPVFKSHFTIDEIKENFKLLGPTTTYCMTREEMAEALKDMLKKVERGYYEPLYLGEKRVMDTYLSCVGPVCSIQMKEEVKDNDC